MAAEAVGAAAATGAAYIIAQAFVDAFGDYVGRYLWAIYKPSIKSSGNTR